MTRTAYKHGLTVDGKPTTAAQLAALLAAPPAPEPRYELRRVRINRALSDETTYFSADIYLDGAKIGEASNHGTGGPNDWHIRNPATAATFELHAHAWAEREGLDFEPVESFIDCLLDDVQHRRTAKARAKKGYPVTALVRVGDDPLRAKFYLLSAKDRRGIEVQAAKMRATVRRWYEEAA